MKHLILGIFVIAVAGCATTYRAPSALAPDTSRSIAGSTTTLLRAAKQVLVSEGFQITNADDAAGVISTAPRDMRLTPENKGSGSLSLQKGTEVIKSI